MGEEKYYLSMNTTVKKEVMNLINDYYNHGSKIWAWYQNRAGCIVFQRMSESFHLFLGEEVEWPLTLLHAGGSERASAGLSTDWSQS